jgi:hypothetical protein
VPCFYVETKNSPPVAELLTASKAFPEKVFHVDWVILEDGPTGELVVQNGEVTENVERCKSWYLFDNLCHPIASLLPAQMPFTLAQHAQLRFEDAIQALGDISQILDDPRFSHSPYQPLRNAPKTGEVQKTLQALQKQVQETAGMLDFEGVFLETFVGQPIRKDALDATTVDISEENLSLDTVL